MPRTLTLAALLAVLLTGVAVAATATITGTRVGKVHRGDRWDRLHDRGLVGRLRAGCELAGPGTRIARLRAPLKGTVQLTRRTPRRVSSIQVTGGAEARGVGIGDALADVTSAYPGAKVDHTTEDVFAFTRVHVRKADGGPISFAVDTATDEVTLIGVPELAVCE